MPYFGDPPGDTMSDRIENKIRDLLVQRQDLNDVQVFYRGDPVIVPVKLMPYSWLMIRDENEATGESGYAESTGMRHFWYDLEVNFEVLYRDAQDLMPVTRMANVTSYMRSKELTQAGMQAVMEWAGPSGNLEDDPVVSADGKEMTIEGRLGRVTNGPQDRIDNVTSRGRFALRIYTRRITF
jgi:hypothetical protein